MQLWNKPYTYFLEKVRQRMEDDAKDEKGQWLSKTSVVKEIETEIEKEVDF